MNKELFTFKNLSEN